MSAYNIPMTTDHDSQVAAEILRFLRAFQQIEVRSTDGLLRVHPPYMLQSTSLLDQPEVFTHMQAHHRLRLERVRAARAAASPPLQALLSRHFYDANGKETGLSRGRAEPHAIRALLQEALELGLAPSQPGGVSLRAWLKTYGVGVDCSGFVQQALSRLRAAFPAAAMAEIPLLRCPWVHRALTSRPQTSQLFDPAGPPCAARPGDILVNPGHMRIVVQKELAQDGLVLHLAESTSASDIPAGWTVEDSDIGPRLIQVVYPLPDLPISAQTPHGKSEWQTHFQPDQKERTYVLGRLRAQQASAPAANLAV